MYCSIQIQIQGYNTYIISLNDNFYILLECNWSMKGLLNFKLYSLMKTIMTIDEN